MRTLLSPISLTNALLASALAASAQGQEFGGKLLITQSAPGAYSVHASDLDGDGDADVLSASYDDDKIAWYENLGSGSFGAQQVITQAADGAFCVYATDLDGDGDADVLSASGGDDKIAWYENLGGGSFGGQQVITQATNSAFSVYATDLDGDGDADVLSASLFDDKIAWYENLGGGSFGGQQVITQTADSATCVYASDLDGDGDADVLSASGGDDKIAWYENLGGGAFGGQQVITQNAALARSVYAMDLDGDGDADVLSASGGDDKIAWYENLGGGSFGGQQVINQATNDAFSVYATDLDGDGDADVLSASDDFNGPIAWYENLGGGTFGDQQIVTQDVNFSKSVYATDLDGDGRLDVLSAETVGKVAWYRNEILTDCNGNGNQDSDDIAVGLSVDCNNNGIPDDCDIATDSTVDANLNSVPDSCEVSGSRYWILSPVTGNWYAVTDELDVTQAQLAALNWGGHLVTIDDDAENDWLAATFGDSSTPIWTGFNDADIEGSFEWVSGAASGFTAWDTATGQPDNAPGLFGGADFTVLDPVSGLWYDEPSDATSFAPGLPRGVVELVSGDCDSNGIPDTYELIQDPNLDCDSNGIHDLCDLQDPALDCDGNGVLDSCQIAADPGLDCDGNGAIDSCEIILDTSLDCDADQNLDVCQITNDPSLDWNGDGLIDSCSGGGFVYCDSNLNASGAFGQTEPLGSPLIGDDSFSLRAYGLPTGNPGVPGMFIMSRSTGYLNPFGAGAGVLCLGAPIRRFNLAAGFPLQFSGAAGDITLNPSIASFPGPNPVQPGEVIHFQLWFREIDTTTGLPTSNTTDGISVMFR